MTSGATKQCWSCEAITPYEVGWCDECITVMPAEVYVLVSSSRTPEPYAGAIRMAVATTLRNLRRPKPAYHPVQKAVKKKLNLSDLGL